MKEWITVCIIVAAFALTYWTRYRIKKKRKKQQIGIVEKIVTESLNKWKH